MVEAIILAGGLGTRLASVVPTLPKALAPIRGKPFLDTMLERLAQSKMIAKAVLAIGYRSDAILRHYEERSAPLPLAYSIEIEPLGTGGALLHALSQTEGKTLLVLNGDCFCNLFYSDFISYHSSKNADLTLAVLHSNDLRRFGSVEFTDEGRITRFQEKSQEKTAGYLSAGIYLIEREVLSSFANGPCSIETDFFPKLLAKNMYAYIHKGSFLDIGTPQSYQLAQQTGWIT